MSATTSTIVRADAAPGMGGGHVMRCLALANQLRDQGAAVTFACAAITPQLANKVRAAGHEVVKLPNTLPPTQAAGWEEMRLPPDLQRADAQATLAGSAAAAWTIVDHYLLDQAWEREVRPGCKLLVIDDLANRRHHCDMLLDQNFGRERRDYEGLVPPDCRLLIGPRFALLRPEFAGAREGSLQQRREPRPFGRLLIALGTADVGGFTVHAARAALQLHPSCAIDLAVGSMAATVEELRELAQREPRITLHVDTDRVADLLANADAAVGAAGTSAWERCCLGVPSVALIVAANQRPGAEALAAADAALIAEDVPALRLQLERLIEDADLRLRLTAASAAITDGRGIERLAELIAGSGDRDAVELRIRAATPADSEILWLWRNDPATRAVSQSRAPVAWPGHSAWFDSALASPDRRIFIAEQNKQAVGMVRMDRIGNRPTSFQASINLAPDQRGTGLGKAILAAGIRCILEDEGAAALEAIIKSDNAASRRIFEALGFRRMRQALATNGFERYVRPEELHFDGL